jgi:hypothetical protein
VKAEKWWGLADKRGRLIKSFVLGTPALFRSKPEAVRYMEGNMLLRPAPPGTRAVRVAVTVSEGKPC